jgi:phage-related protein
MQKHNYKIIESKENPMESVIEKDNITVQFSLVSMTTQAEAVKKKLKELEAQLEVDKASMQNVENNHPETRNLTEKKIKEAHNIVLHTEFKTAVETITKQIEEIKQAFVDYEAELKEIEEQTGIKPLTELNPEDLNV